jgi:hypothetical protein
MGKEQDNWRPAGHHANMRLCSYVAIGVLCLTASFGAASAPLAQSVGAAKATAPERVQLLLDQRTGAFRFVIDGVEAATLTSSALVLHRDLRVVGAIQKWKQP